MGTLCFGVFAYLLILPLLPADYFVTLFHCHLRQPITPPLNQGGDIVPRPPLSHLVKEGKGWSSGCHVRQYDKVEPLPTYHLVPVHI